MKRVILDNEEGFILNNISRILLEEWVDRVMNNANVKPDYEKMSRRAWLRERVNMAYPDGRAVTPRRYRVLEFCTQGEWDRALAVRDELLGYSGNAGLQELSVAAVEFLEGYTSEAGYHAGALTQGDRLGVCDYFFGTREVVLV